MSSARSWGYDDEESAAWLAAALEAADEPLPGAGAATASRSTARCPRSPPNAPPRSCRARTAAGRRRSRSPSAARRSPTTWPGSGRSVTRSDPTAGVRVDANGGWSVREAVEAIAELSAFDLEYVEQPVATVEELPAGAPAASTCRSPPTSRSGEPATRCGCRLLEAADIAVLKVQPLGGVRACLELAEAVGLPVVVSSALESSVGIASGVALAAALPSLPYACGLATTSMLTADVTRSPLPADRRGSWRRDASA